MRIVRVVVVVGVGVGVVVGGCGVDFRLSSVFTRCTPLPWLMTSLRISSIFKLPVVLMGNSSIHKTDSGS